MKIDLPNIDEIIKSNNLPEITNPVYIEGSNIPTADGLFSYELFGRPGSTRRRLQYGWIDLGRPFLHPTAYKQMQKLFTKLPDLVAGRKNFSVGTNGIIVEDEKGGTGLEWLYKNYEKINLDDRGSRSRSKRTSLFKLFPKNRIFTSKWITVPPFYFDINLRTGDSARSIDELGSMYIKLISVAKMLKNEGQFFSAYSSEFNIQSTLVEISDYFCNRIAKKQGIIHKDILGKNIDYSTRTVISCAPIRNANSYHDLLVPYGHVGIPLHQLAALFMPFVVAEMQARCQSLSTYKMYISNGKGLAMLDNTIDQISSTHFEKLIKFYAKSPENRLQRFILETQEGANIMDEAYEKEFGRKYLLIDFLYACVQAVIKDKFVIMVRFPLEDYRNVEPFKPVILTTEETLPEIHIYGQTYKNYPDVKAKKLHWIDSSMPNSTTLPAFDGDFDGDTMSLKGVFSQEANEELARSIASPLMLMNPAGGQSREIQKEALVSLYGLTK